jgi:hypothetical protein
VAGKKDKYGIPPGGNTGAWTAHNFAGISYALPWREVMAAVALGGWPEHLWGMAGAVCAAESSRNPFIYNTYKMGHFGLFQISRSDWPEFFSESVNDGMSWIYPSLNAKKAYEIYKKQGWGAWEGKTNGGYLAYYTQAMLAAADLQRKTGLHGGDEKGYWDSLRSDKTLSMLMKAANVSAADIAKAANQSLGEAVAGAANATADGVVSAGGDVAAAVSDTFGWMPDLWNAITTPALWMRMGYGALGVVLVGGGLFMIVRNRPAVKSAAATIAKVTPIGKAAAA